MGVRIDVRTTLRDRIGADIEDYVILGARNPEQARASPRHRPSDRPARRARRPGHRVRDGQVKQDLREVLTKAGLVERTGEDRIFPTMPTAVRAFHQRHTEPDQLG